jgi:hypothetical protein
MISKEYEIKVLLNTKKLGANKKPLHIDVTKPQEAQNPGINGETGKFFQVSLLASKGITAGGKKKSSQGKTITFNIWDTGVRALIFQDLADQLAAGKFTLDSTGNAVLTEYGCDGSLLKEDCLAHILWDTVNDKPLVDGNGLPLIRDFLQLFIFDFEEAEGTASVLFASEQRRRLAHPANQPSEKSITAED